MLGWQRMVLDTLGPDCVASNPRSPVGKLPKLTMSQAFSSVKLEIIVLSILDCYGD